jgi:hypothetical protein
MADGFSVQLTSERGKIGGRFDQRDRRAEEIRRLHAVG